MVQVQVFFRNIADPLDDSFAAELLRKFLRQTILMVSIGDIYVSVSAGIIRINLKPNKEQWARNWITDGAALYGQSLIKIQ